MPEEIRLSVAVPTAGMVRMGFAQSLALMLTKLAAQGIPTRREAAIQMQLHTAESSVIHGNRETLVKNALASNLTHLMFLDDDMVFEPNIIDVLFGRRHPVVAVNYPIKSIPIEFVAVGMNGRRIVTHEGSTGLEPILYSGFGCSLFEVEVFRRTPQPWFLPEYVPESRSYTTEDNPCFRRIREAGFPCYLDHDASKLVSHVGHKAFSWREWKPEQKSEA